MAKSAVEWCKSVGGNIPHNDLAGKLSHVGADGRYKANIERDCQMVITTFGKRFGAKISTAPVRMWNPKKSCVEKKNLPLIYPDDFASALWTRSPKIFRKLLLGDGNVKQYWEHCRNYCEWFRSHPSYNHANNWDNMVPLSLYGDDVQAYRNSECGSMSIVAWSSDLSTQSSFKSRYYLITAFSEHEECAYTFNDLMTAVSERIKMMVTPRLAQERGYPWLESGYSFMLSSLQGDLKWVNQHYGNLFDYRGNDFCGYCECKKRHDLPGMTLGDFTPSALHRSTIKTCRREDLVNRSFTWISYGCFCFDCLQFFFFVCGLLFVDQIKPHDLRLSSLLDTRVTSQESSS